MATMSPMTLVPSGNPPLHIALLPDGGRRWAIANGVSLNESYSQSILKLYQVSTALFELDCDHVSILMSGHNNHKLRTEQEIQCMNTHIRLFVERCNEQLRADMRCNVEVFAPADIAKEVGITPGCLIAEKPVKEEKTLSLFVGYSPNLEINDAIQKSISMDGSAEGFLQHLWVTRPVDLLVRTGGYQVLSGFLPLITGYSRLYFVRELFNDVDVATFDRIIAEFLRVPRLYGV